VSVASGGFRLEDAILNCQQADIESALGTCEGTILRGFSSCPAGGPKCAESHAYAVPHRAKVCS
jgi:hypothetical protein